MKPALFLSLFYPPSTFSSVTLTIPFIYFLSRIGWLGSMMGEVFGSIDYDRISLRKSR